MRKYKGTNFCRFLRLIGVIVTLVLQESPAIADKPARRKKPAKNCSNSTCLQRCRWQLLAYFHSFSCCCVRNLRNPAKFTENSNLWSSRSSKVIDLGVNRKPIY